MLLNIKEIYGARLIALDGDIGPVQDFYFDDSTWEIRYAVVNTEGWLAGPPVLISRRAFGEWNKAGKSLQVKLRKKQIEDSRPVELHSPQTPPYEAEFFRSYGWPAYWEGGEMWGAAGFPLVAPPSTSRSLLMKKEDDEEHSRVRSMTSLTGYHLQADDGAIGSVSGFMVDDQTWMVAFLIVETGHCYPGKKILIVPNKIAGINYEESNVAVHLTKEEIKQTLANEVATTDVGM